MDRGKQQKMVNLDRGLFLVRYVAAEDQLQPPKVKISPDRPSNKGITFFLHPDHKEAVLWQPETCLVVRALAPGQLAVQVIPSHDGGSVAATVRIETLSQGVARESTRTKAKIGASQDRGALRVLGHVKGIGDVVVNANEWVAGPSAPLRIEGISLEWPDKPEDLEINYAVKTAKPHAISGRAVGLGSFAGTRGNALPVIAVMMQISGRAAANFQLSVEAVFLGSPPVRSVGKRVVISGPTGQEPLVGLRLGLDEVRPTKQIPAKSSPRKSRRSGGRVRVFRARAKSNRPATA